MAVLKKMFWTVRWLFAISNRRRCKNNLVSRKYLCREYCKMRELRYKPLAIKTVSQVQTIWTSELNKYLELALCSHLCACFFFFFYCFWQVNDRATNFGSGLVHLGCEPSQNTFVGIYGPNCVEVSVRVIIILIVIGWVTGVCKNPTYNGPPNCFLQSSCQWRI